VNRSVVTWLGIAAVALAAAVLSFASLRSLAIVCGTPSTLAWLLPVCIDAAALVATGVWLGGEEPEGARGFAKALTLGMILLSVAGNATEHFLAAYSIRPPWWAVVAVASVPPAVLGAVAHLAALAATKRPAVPVAVPVQTEPVPVDPPTVEQADHQADHQAPGGDLVTRAAYLVAAGDAEGRKVGRGTLARQLGITENQARQVLRQVADQRTPALYAIGSEQR
jgi:hypothetical protein